MEDTFDKMELTTDLRVDIEDHLAHRMINKIYEHLGIRISNKQQLERLVTYLVRLIAITPKD